MKFKKWINEEQIPLDQMPTLKKQQIPLDQMPTLKRSDTSIAPNLAKTAKFDVPYHPESKTLDKIHENLYTNIVDGLKLFEIIKKQNYFTNDQSKEKIFNERSKQFEEYAKKALDSLGALKTALFIND